MSAKKSFSQTVRLPLSISQAYNALANGAAFSEFTGAPASIRPVPGSTFEVYGGVLNGFILDTAPNERIVQAFRTKDWAPGVFSILDLRFRSLSENETEIELIHYGIPESHNESNEKVWDEFYWKKLRNWRART